MYYAALHNYDVRFVNDVTEILRFKTRRERDEWVDSEEWDGNFRRESVSRDRARLYVPQAFRITCGYELNWWDIEGDHETWSYSGHHIG